MLEPRGIIRGAPPRFKLSDLIPPVAYVIRLSNELFLRSKKQWNSTVLQTGLWIEEFWYIGECWSQEV
eukprot:839466-Pelagomonas_calceolata.AAC.1